LLLEKGADPNTSDNEGFTPLMYAAVKGHFEAANLLLGKGADVNAVEKSGGTALMLASHEGQTEVVKLLLEKGADVNVKEKTGKTALSMASSKGHEDIVKLLKDTKLKIPRLIKPEATQRLACGAFTAQGCIGKRNDTAWILRVQSDHFGASNGQVRGQCRSL
jgi:uncharacterized protein